MTNKQILLSIVAGAVILIICFYAFKDMPESNAEEFVNQNMPSAGKTAGDASTQPVENWGKRCNEDNGKCEIVQTAYIKQNDRPARFVEIALSKNSDTETLVFVSVPLGVSVQNGVILDANEKDDQLEVVPMKTCYANGCVAVAKLKPEFVNDMKMGKDITIYFTALNGKKVQTKFSLIGFTKAYDAL